MADRKNLCALVVDVVGGPFAEASATGTLEFRHAIDRCLRRIDLAIDANNGVSLGRSDHGISANFERCDSAVLSACEMLERTRNLPPLRGKRFSVKAGIHYGQGGEGTQPGEAHAVARQLAIAARNGEALATNAVVMQLSQATRHFAKPEGTEQRNLPELDWPLYSVARQTDSVISVPPATRLQQRLRIRHQGEVVLVDDVRPIVLFGREFGNDVVVMDPRASRQHSRIERRRGGFVLIDYSTNGTFVVEEDGSERTIKGAETVLVGPGRIGCGFSTSEIERDLVFFEIV